MKKKMFLVIVVILVMSVFLPTIALAGWRSEQYSIYVTSQIDSARLDKGGEAYDWQYAYDYNTTSYRHATTTPTNHYAVPITLDAVAMGYKQIVSHGEYQMMPVLWYTSERSIKVRFSKYNYAFDASGSVAAYFE